MELKWAPTGLKFEMARRYSVNIAEMKAFDPNGGCWLKILAGTAPVKDICR